MRRDILRFGRKSICSALLIACVFGAGLRGL